MSEIKLLPCPFCGEEVELHEIEPHMHVLVKFMPDCKGEVIIECKCGCSIIRSTKVEAAKAWNTRKPIEDMVEQLKEKKNSNPSMMFEADCWRKGIDDAIDIVRGGRG